MSKKRDRLTRRRAGNIDPKRAIGGTAVIKGLDEIRRNLRLVAKNMREGLVPSLQEVVRIIQRESMNRTPIDTGNLRGGHRSKVYAAGKSFVGAVYTLASYSLFVHEASEQVTFKSPWPRGRKFLERAITENLDLIRFTIRKWLGG